MHKHGSTELDPTPDANDEDPLNWRKYQVRSKPPSPRHCLDLRGRRSMEMLAHEASCQDAKANDSQENHNACIGCVPCDDGDLHGSRDSIGVCKHRGGLASQHPGCKLLDFTGDRDPRWSAAILAATR